MRALYNRIDAMLITYLACAVRRLERSDRPKQRILRQTDIRSSLSERTTVIATRKSVPDPAIRDEIGGITGTEEREMLGSSSICKNSARRQRYNGCQCRPPVQHSRRNASSARASHWRLSRYRRPASALSARRAPSRPSIDLPRCNLLPLRDPGQVAGWSHPVKFVDADLL